MNAMVLVACLAGEPTDCVAVQLSELMPMHQCIITGQPIAAQWIAAHPGYRVEKIRCMHPKDLLITLSKYRT